MLLSKLYERYDQPAIDALYRRAAVWLADHALLDEALRYLTTIGDFDAAADLLERQRIAQLNEQRFQELAEALTLIPMQLVNERPILLITLAWIRRWRLEHRQCAVALQRVEYLLQEQAATLTASTRYTIQLELVALLADLDRTQANKEVSALIQVNWAHALPYLTHIHSDVVTTLADACQRLGKVETGLAIIATALEQNSRWPQITRCSLLNMRALLHLWDCNPPQAERDFLVNLQQARQHGFGATAALCQLGLGAIASARHELDMAEAHLREVLTSLNWENGRYAMLSIGRLIELYAFQGFPQRARPLVEQLKEFAALVGLPYLYDHVAAVEAYLAMHCGDLPRVLRWALAGAQTTPNLSMYSVADRIPLIRAYILLAEGSPASLQQATQLLQALSHYQESQYQWYYLIEALSLLALTWAGLGQMEPALAALDRAVQRAAPNGMVGLFVRQGPPMKQLLQTLRKQSAQPPMVELLIAAFPTNSVALPAPEMIESLTDRKLAVLRLIATGLSNKEIAQRLIVSIHSVRNHTANIFGKLQVENQVQAVERAHTLALLPPI